METYYISFVNPAGVVVFNTVFKAKSEKKAASLVRREFLEFGRKRGAYSFTTTLAFDCNAEKVLEMKVEKVVG